MIVVTESHCNEFILFENDTQSMEMLLWMQTLFLIHIHLVAKQEVTDAVQTKTILCH